MGEIYGSNIDYILNDLLVTYYTLQDKINSFEYYKSIIDDDFHPDFIKAKVSMWSCKTV
jgi:hypothetical protein